MLAGDELPVDESDDHVRQHDQGEEFTGCRPGEALGLHQKRQPPQQNEDHPGELRREVHPHAEPGPGLPPGVGDLTPDETRPAVVAHRLRSVALGVVLEEQQDQDEDDDAADRAAGERRGPAETAQQPGQDQRGDQVAGDADEPGDLRDERPAPGREPAVAQAQHTDERHRVAAAEQDPRAERGAVGVGEGEAQLARGEQEDAEGQDPLGAEPVHQQAHRDLHPGVDEQLDDREGRQRGGVDVEPFDGVESGHAQAGAVGDGDEVDGDADAPDGDGAGSAGWIPGQARAGGGCGAAHRDSPRTRLRTQPTCRCTAAAAASASPVRSASRISACSAMFLAIRSGWACITATPMRS